MNNINETEIENIDFVICKICNKKFKFISNTHLWKIHQLTCEEYQELYPGSKLICDKTIEKRVEYTKGKTYEEIYGEEKAQTLKNIRSEDAEEQMKDNTQRKIRSEKCGAYERTDEYKNNVSLLKTVHGGTTYRKRALEYYGLECKRCGLTTEHEEDFIVHHIDFQNVSSELGNHDISNLMVLCKSCHSKLHNEINKKINGWVGLDDVEKGVHYIFKGLKKIGLNLKDENFKDTPKRVARAYYEIFSGIVNTESQINDILSTSFPNEGYDEIILVNNITCYSMCPHHLLPVEYRVSVGYLPSENGNILGISKLARLVKVLAKRPILQETFTIEISNYLNAINPLGIIVLVKGKHYCMRMRGVEEHDALVTTSSVKGYFREDRNAKNEALKLVNINDF